MTTTTGPASPQAIRLRRPGWRDPRLLLGLLLVAGAVALGTVAVQAAGRTVPVLTARTAVVPGEPVDRGDLVVREVRLAEAEGEYLRADAAVDPDLVAVRAIGAGELVPVDAVATGAALDVRAVAVRPSNELSRAVVEGAVVDLWFVAATEGASDAAAAAPAAVPLAQGVTVAEVGEDSASLTASGPTVHVLVPTADLPGVLAALAGDGTVEVVPVAGSGR
jgi:hypothetical protein